MRVLVTGGTGFIGSNLAKELLRRGHEVVVTGHDAEQPLPKEITRMQCSMIGLDFNRIGKVDVLFHQAAINDTTLMDKQEMFRANVDSSKKLFEQVITLGCKRIVYASSTAAYGNAPVPLKEDGVMNPLNPYGESKKVLDEYAMALAKKQPEVIIVGLRYCNVYGPGESHKGKRASMIYQLAHQMVNGNPAIFKNGEQKREWIYVRDVVKANLLGMQAKQSCVVNCGTGSPITFNEIITTLNTVLKLKRKPVYIDNPYEETYQSHIECDMTKAKELLGFTPEYTLIKGCEDYLASKQLLQ